MGQIDYIDFDERVEKFLRNQMSTEEIATFKAELTADEEKKQRAHTIALMVKTMNKIGLERDQRVVNSIKNISEVQFRKVAGLKPHIMPIWPRIAKYAIAACFTGLLVFGGFKFYGYQQTTALGSSAYLLYTSDITLSGEHRGVNMDSNVVIELKGLFSNVENNHELKRTILQLETAYSNALQETSPYGDYVDDIAWNLAIAYLKKGNKEKPIPLLKGMIERNKGYIDITRPAQELLQKIYEL